MFENITSSSKYLLQIELHGALVCPGAVPADKGRIYNWRVTASKATPIVRARR